MEARPDSGKHVDKLRQLAQNTTDCLTSPPPSRCHFSFQKNMEKECCRKNNVEKEKKPSECELQDSEILQEYSKHALKGILQHMTAKSIKKTDPPKLTGAAALLPHGIPLKLWLKYAAHLAGQAYESRAATWWTPPGCLACCLVDYLTLSTPPTSP